MDLVCTPVTILYSRPDGRQGRDTTALHREPKATEALSSRWVVECMLFLLLAVAIELVVWLLALVCTTFVTRSARHRTDYYSTGCCCCRCGEELLVGFVACRLVVVVYTPLLLFTFTSHRCKTRGHLLTSQRE